MADNVHHVRVSFWLTVLLVEIAAIGVPAYSYVHPPVPNTHAVTMRLATVGLGLGQAGPRKILHGLTQAKATIAVNHAPTAWQTLNPLANISPKVELFKALDKEEEDPCAFGCLAYDGSARFEKALADAKADTQESLSKMRKVFRNSVETARLFKNIMVMPFTTVAGLLQNFASTYNGVGLAADAPPQAVHAATEQALPPPDEKEGPEPTPAQALMYKLEQDAVQHLKDWHIMIPALEPPTRPRTHTPRARTQTSSGVQQESAFKVLGTDSAKIQLLKQTSAEVNKILIDRVLKTETDAPWRQTHNKEGVQIWQATLPEQLHGLKQWPHGLGPASPKEAGSRFECVKARGIVDYPPDCVFNVFSENENVPEFNEFCTEIEDVVWLDKETKIAWGASPRVGPFSPRDFVTRCYLGKTADGVWIAANMAEDLPCTEQRSKGKAKEYVRMEVLLGATIGRPVDGGKRTEYTMLVLTNPGGAADTPVGASVLNKMAASGPIAHIKAMNKLCSRFCGPEKWPPQASTDALRAAAAAAA